MPGAAHITALTLEIADEEVRSARWSIAGKETVLPFSAHLTRNLHESLTGKVGVASAGVPVALDPLEVRQLFMDQGLSPTAALSWGASFKGLVTLRRVEAGESFYRYTDRSHSTGYFLTKEHLSYREEACRELNLDEHLTRNLAHIRQLVTCQQTTLLIEGEVNGSMDAMVREPGPDGSMVEHSVANGPSVQDVIVAPHGELERLWHFGPEITLHGHTDLVPVGPVISYPVGQVVDHAASAEHTEDDEEEVLG